MREYAQLVQQSRAEAGEAATLLGAVKEELAEARKTINFLEGQVCSQCPVHRELVL